jgi:hypothetical protein
MDKNASSFSKKRITSYSHYTERGKIPTNKNNNDAYVGYESLGEATLIILHDHDPNCIAIESQPIQMPNKSGIIIKLLKENCKCVIFFVIGFGNIVLSI